MIAIHLPMRDIVDLNCLSHDFSSVATLARLPIHAASAIVKNKTPSHFRSTLLVQLVEVRVSRTRQSVVQPVSDPQIRFAEASHR